MFFIRFVEFLSLFFYSICGRQFSTSGYQSVEFVDDNFPLMSIEFVENIIYYVVEFSFPWISWKFNDWSFYYLQNNFPLVETCLSLEYVANNFHIEFAQFYFPLNLWKIKIIVESRWIQSEICILKSRCFVICTQLLIFHTLLTFMKPERRSFVTHSLAFNRLQRSQKQRHQIALPNRNPNYKWACLLHFSICLYFTYQYTKYIFKLTKYPQTCFKKYEMAKTEFSKFHGKQDSIRWKIIFHQFHGK